ncbi:MAG: tetratricopeptide repeat protein [Anaerolineales bacterium]
MGEIFCRKVFWSKVGFSILGWGVPALTCLWLRHSQKRDKPGIFDALDTPMVVTDFRMTSAISRSRFFILSSLTIIVGVLGWQAPGVLALYHQMQGGRFLAPVLETVRETDAVTFACASPPLTDEDLRDSLKKARGHLGKALEYNPELSHAYLLLGRANCLLGAASEAVRAYRAYTRLRPDNPLGHLELGFAWEGVCLAQNRNAITTLGEIESWQRCSSKFLNEVILTAWDEAGLTAKDFFKVGDQAFQDKRYEEALWWYGRANKIAPNWVEPFLSMGQVFEKLQNPEKALQIYQVAWQKNLQESVAVLANALQRQGNFETEEAILRQALTDFPTSPNRLMWWRTLGTNLRKQKAWEAALQVYRDALREFPSDPLLHIGLGWSMYEHGDSIENALNVFQQAIALDDRRGEGYFAIAQLFAREKNYSEADPWFRLATENDPTNAWYSLNHANNVRNAGNVSLALLIYEDILARSPHYAWVHYEIAWAYHLLGRHQEAIAAIEQALGLFSSPDQWHYLRAGAIFEAAGDLERALYYFNETLAIEPTNSSAHQAINRLQK